MAAPFILVVDDNETLASLLSTRLTALGYESLYALDALQANARIQKRKPDLMLLDFTMPAGHGGIVLQRARQSISSSIPVIVITAMPLDQVQKAIPPSQTTLFHQKPIDFPVLEKQIRNLLHLPDPPASGGTGAASPI